MKKLLVFGIVCMAGLGSCKPSFCPAYSQQNSVKNQQHMVKAEAMPDKDRS